MNQEERITRGKAIRLKCLDCCCGSAAEVRLCKSKACPLWRYRMGKELLPENHEDAAILANKASGGVPAKGEEESP